MQILPGAFIGGLRGKECMHSKSYARQNRVTGKVTSGKLCNPSTKAPSADQLSARADFKTLVQQAREWIKDSANATEVQKLRKAYMAQTTIGTFHGFIAKQIKNGNIVIA